MENNLAGCCAGRGGESFCNNRSLFNGVLVKNRVKQFIELVWLNTLKSGFFVNLAFA